MDFLREPELSAKAKSNLSLSGIVVPSQFFGQFSAISRAIFSGLNKISGTLPSSSRLLVPAKPRVTNDRNPDGCVFLTIRLNHIFKWYLHYIYFVYFPRISFKHLILCFLLSPQILMIASFSFLEIGYCLKKALREIVNSASA